MPTLTINDTPHAYQEAGQGSPVLLIHAGIADLRMWDEVWPAFTGRHRSIRYDMRGYGDTPLPDGPFTYAADAAGLQQALGVERAHVVGVSMGAGVALDLALARPELVDRLVLVAPGLPDWDWAPEMDVFDEQEAELFDRGELDEASWLNVRFWLDGPTRQPEEVDADLRRRVFEMQRRAFEWENPKADGSWLVPDRGERLAEVRSSTLVVAGELDQPDFAGVGQHMAERIPNARLEVMPGVAHLPPMEAPDEFSRLVLDFLRE
ncbi:MAG TPA: alpha/beta hydrolase [Candidatus Limnocylindria bacterium]|nr:alpha/beta hydrolase [Candidatus Limnocylindria bacterium]